MTLVRLGYVAMSMQLQNASPSQTMTYKQFSQIQDREAALRKLERIAVSNIENCLRLLKHNQMHDIHFFRLSSKLIPLANHPELEDWNFLPPLKKVLKELGEYANSHKMRIGFHPDHFVVLNGTDVDILKNSLVTLKMHEALLKLMNIPRQHRCVLHVGGAYEDKEKALEQFIHNWSLTPTSLQEMLILENDDTVFTVSETLYLCEKLGIPLVFDYHHHLANHTSDWKTEWPRIVQSWEHSPLPLKMHISSPRSEKDFNAHSDYIDPNMFLEFLQHAKGSVDQIDCMIEAKQKDEALFKLVEDLQKESSIEWVDKSSFYIK